MKPSRPIGVNLRVHDSDHTCMNECQSLIHKLTRVGSEAKRQSALRQIQDALTKPIPPPAATQRKKKGLRSFSRDLQHAATLVARGVDVGSWSRNAAWVTKFRGYVRDNCPPT